MKRSEVAKLLAVAKRFYPKIDTDEAMLDDYCRLLDDVSYEAANAVLTAHLKTSPFFPRPSELRPNEPPRMNPADYQGTAYLDVPWMRTVSSGAPVAIGTGGQRRKAG